MVDAVHPSTISSHHHIIMSSYQATSVAPEGGQPLGNKSPLLRFVRELLNTTAQATMAAWTKNNRTGSTIGYPIVVHIV